MNFLGRNIELFIFDLDGVIFDSTGLWQIVDDNFFHRRGMETPKNYAKIISHMGLEECAEFTKKTYGIKESCEQMLKEWKDDSKEMYEKEIELKPGAMDFLRYLKSNKCKIVCATSNDESLYLPCLKRTGVFEFFDKIYDVKKIGFSKNENEFFNYILSDNNVTKNEAVMFDDTPSVVKTIHDVGIFTIAVDDTASKEDIDFKKKNSDFFVFSLKELIEK